jgi:transcriptional regulator with XRE-family HTH domain
MSEHDAVISPSEERPSEDGAKTKRVPDVGAYVPDVGSYIREQRRRAKLSLRKLADQAGVSNPYLSQIERGLRQPSVKILNGIAKALRVSAETLYAQAGILEQASGETDVLRSIYRDTGLTEGQRRTLAELYERFRIETAERRSRRQQRRLRAAGGEER